LKLNKYFAQHNSTGNNRITQIIHERTESVP